MGRRMKGPQKEDLSTVVVDRIRRRLRQNGFRCHITLQVPSFPFCHVVVVSKPASFAWSTFPPSNIRMKF